LHDFWLLLRVCAGLLAYKIASEHRWRHDWLSNQYRAFGRAAAKFDDVLNGFRQLTALI
jgi:cobalamin biosynthesis protein CobD/CbiB